MHKYFYMLTNTEENYLKAVWKLSFGKRDAVNTNALAKHLGTTAASVTDMLKRLCDKQYISYERYKGAKLTVLGRQSAVGLVRRHRLWEVFLVQKLGFGWDEVHDIAEELEHIQSEKLIRLLADFLGNPSVDPHGDPIPDENGVFLDTHFVLLSTLTPLEKSSITGVDEHSSAFLQYLAAQNLLIGREIQVLETYSYDNSMKILIVASQQEVVISQKVAQNLLVSRF